MNMKGLLISIFGIMLMLCCMAGCVNSENILSDSNIMGNVENDSLTVESPSGDTDYSVYEPYGLKYNQENHYYTYNGNVVRFFNDSVAGVSFTNYFSGTVDIEAERDDDNNLVGIKECSEDDYNRHTQRYNGVNTEDTSLSTLQAGGTSQLWLKDYTDYGIAYNEQKGGWYYNNQQIKILLDRENDIVYVDDNAGICVSVLRDGNYQISGIKEISETDTQLFMQTYITNGDYYTIQE